MQESPTINQQDRQGHVLWICLPQGDLPTVHSRYTYRSSTLPGGPLGGLPSLSLITKGSWIHLWREGRQASRQFSDASTPSPKVSHYFSALWMASSLSVCLSVCLRLTAIFQVDLG